MAEAIGFIAAIALFISVFAGIDSLRRKDYWWILFAIIAGVSYVFLQISFSSW